ncbi:MAG: disulfide bond chaperone [Planctomycetota bacterium]|nr:MAG: disulfide bond chaperone [Planctomycetota bacterium]
MSPADEEREPDEVPARGGSERDGGAGSEPAAAGPRPDEVPVEAYFVRGRNAMALWADFGRIFEDHYLHLMQLGVRLTAEQDELLKESLALLTLFLASRPNDESVAWTLNFREPPLNVFVTGDSVRGNVVGRVFTEDVKTAETDLFFAQVSSPRNPMRRSTVEIRGRDMLRVVEDYHRQSEQFPARFFRLGGDRYGMLVAHPDVDRAWYESLDVEGFRRLAEDEELRLIERRAYHYACGCDLDLVLKVVVDAYGRDPERILAGQERIEVRCPRCGGVFHVGREGIERYLRENP